MLSKSAMPKHISKELSRIEESINKRRTHKTFQSKQNYGPVVFQKKERNSFISKKKEIKQKLVLSNDQYFDHPSPQFVLSSPQPAFALSPPQPKFGALLEQLKHRNEVYSLVEPYLSNEDDPALQLQQIFRASLTLKKIIAQLRKNIGKQDSSIEQMRNWIKQQQGI